MELRVSLIKLFSFSTLTLLCGLLQFSLYLVGPDVPHQILKMHFSTLAVFLLASSAVAKKSCSQKIHTDYVTFTVTAGCPGIPSSSTPISSASLIQTSPTTSKKSIVSTIPTAIGPIPSVASTTSISVASITPATVAVVAASTNVSSTLQAASSAAPLSISSFATELIFDE